MNLSCGLSEIVGSLSVLRTLLLRDLRFNVVDLLHCIYFLTSLG